MIVSWKFHGSSSYGSLDVLFTDRVDAKYLYMHWSLPASSIKTCRSWHVLLHCGLPAETCPSSLVLFTWIKWRLFWVKATLNSAQLPDCPFVALRSCRCSTLLFKENLNNDPKSVHERRDLLSVCGRTEVTPQASLLGDWSALWIHSPRTLLLWAWMRRS